MINILRRTLLRAAGYGIAGALTGLSKAYAVTKKTTPVSDVDTTLTSALGQQQLDKALPNQTPLWQYNQTTPGPLIRARQGETISITYNNHLAESSAIHWHGLRINNKMDGVVGMTQPPVEPNESFHYQFTVPDAGTYWYHAHQRSYEQVGRGLYGVMVIDETKPPDVDQDIVLAFDDWRLDDVGDIHESFNHMHDVSHQGRIGNWLTVNGKGAETVNLNSGERVRLRLVNTANSLVMNLALPKWQNWLMALDGMPITPTENLKRITLSPGQRADFFIDCPNETTPNQEISLITRQGVIPLVDVIKIAHEERPQRTQAPERLSANMPITDTKEPAERIMLNLEGGAMGGLQQATLDNQLFDIQDLVKQGKVWALNGISDLPNEPLIKAQHNKIYEIEIRNQTAWPHAMHLHGHHFEVYEDFGPWIRGDNHSVNQKVKQRVLRDTVTVDRDQTIIIRFRADNPGKWLLHCHMLEHQAGGMVTWINVA